ncbi:protein of unknown function [Tenacibaculum jejuense]|uniref:Uncharacterized protein n=2 Tax=Tenacibaculum jejuense TaxID=584609 RepID=A0A238U4Y4_9FLAO|nr:protein of unknown function [Tenacibaculum jejuense]
MYLLLSVWSCKHAGNKTEINKKKTELDSVLIKNFLLDPRDNSSLKNLDFKTNLKQLTNANDSTYIFPRENYYVEYLKDNRKIAEMSFSTYKTDSTWTFGTNGLRIQLFESDNKEFPLKYNLTVGTKVSDFFKTFGTPTEFKKKYLYDFKFNLFSSRLILEHKNNIIKKITIANTVYN